MLSEAFMIPISDALSNCYIYVFKERGFEHLHNLKTCSSLAAFRDFSIPCLYVNF